MTIRPRAHLAGVEICYHGSFSDREGAERGIAARDVIDFSASCNPLGTSPRVLEAMRAVDPSRYPDDEARALRAALAERAGVQIDWVAVGNGSVELIYHLAAAYLEPEDTALVVGPTFGEYERACRAAGAEVLGVRAKEEDGFRIDAAAVASTIRTKRPKLAFICNPNNPTGQVNLEPTVGQILGECESTLLVVDEAYLPFCDQAIDLRPFLASGRLLLLRSLTKDHGLAGLRLGYVIAPPHLLDPIRRVRPPWTVNALAQAAGMAALEDAGHLEEARRVVVEARAFLAQELSALGFWTVPSVANFLLVRTGNGATFRSALLENGVCVRDCASFGLPAYVRIGVRRMEECQRLVEAVREVARRA